MEDDRIGEIIGFPGDNGLFSIKDEKSDKWGYINISGEMVIQPKYEMAFPFYEGKAFVREADKDNYLIINEKGEIIEDDVSSERMESLDESRYENEENPYSSDEAYKLVQVK